MGDPVSGDTNDKDIPFDRNRSSFFSSRLLSSLYALTLPDIRLHRCAVQNPQRSAGV